MTARPFCLLASPLELCVGRRIVFVRLNSR